MVRAWFLNVQEETDTTKKLSLDELREETEILSWQLNPNSYQGDLDKIRKERGYIVANEIEISPESLADYEEKVKSFHKEHLHEEEEVHFILKGMAYFDVRSNNDTWIRIELLAGDLVVFPPRIYHRLTLIEHQNITILRLFKEEVRSIQYRSSEVEDLIMDCRQKYLESQYKV